MGLRTCRVCGYTSDNLEDFKKHSKAKYGRSNLCKECGNKRSKECLAKRKDIFDSMKHTCTLCGKEYPPFVLDFHHIPASSKSFGIARAINDYTYTIEDILQEIKKCIIVCSNCHRILHHCLGDDDYGNET